MDKCGMAVMPIRVIHSPFTEAKGTPIQPRFADGVRGYVEVYEEYVDGLTDVDGFERIWLLFWCDRAKEYKLRVKPYMDVRERGLFSTRAPSRPNPVGISCAKVERVEGCRIYVAELDILDGTPLLDIKPYSSKFDCFEVSRNGWQDAQL